MLSRNQNIGNIFLSYFNHDYRLSLGIDDDQSKSVLVDLLKNILNLSVFLCEDYCILPPTFILESPISLAAAEFCEDYFFESLIKLPIRDKSFAYMYEKKLNEYAYAKNKHRHLFDNSAVKGLVFLQRVGRNAIIGRSAKIGKNLAQEWEAGPEVSDVWRDIKDQYSFNTINCISIIPRKLYQDNIAVTWASINKMAKKSKINIEVNDIQRVHLEIYNRIYTNEYNLIEIINLPYYRKCINHNNGYIDFVYIKKILQFLGMYDVVLKATARFMIELRNSYGYTIFIRGIKYLFLNATTYGEIKISLHDIFRLSNSIECIKNDLISNIHRYSFVTKLQTCSALLEEFGQNTLKYCNAPTYNRNIKKYDILYLSANPLSMAPLKSNKEFIEIHNAFQNASEKYSIYSDWAVTPTDIQNAIFLRKPRIIHFSGHGTIDDKELVDLGKSIGVTLDANAGLCVHDDGKIDAITIGTKDISNLFSIAAKEIDITLVVLNACFSNEHAKAISKYVPFVIGLNYKISDDAAIIFSTGLYNAIATGIDIEVAFDRAINLINLNKRKGALAYVLHKGN